MSDFKDYFSTQAEDYARYRPDYPVELIQFILSQVPQRRQAWDCATGSGQVARFLSPYFTQVVATDASAAQIQKAFLDPKIKYSVSPAEDSGLPENSIDLITVAQAIHWFDHAKFYQEVARVARPGALLAIWGYGLLRVEKELDAILDELYYQILGNTYWPPERRHIDEAYAQIPFPFDRVEVPLFSMEKPWDLSELLGYIQTWSAVQQYIKRHEESPLSPFVERLQKAWGDPKKAKVIRWPILERMAIV